MRRNQQTKEEKKMESGIRSSESGEEQPKEILDNKEQLVQTIKEWVRVDNELRLLQREVAVRRKRKLEISSRLAATMRTNSIDRVEIQGGALVYDKRNVKRPLSQKLLGELVNGFYREDPQMAAALSTFLQEHRPETEKETIVRKEDKKKPAAPVTADAVSGSSA